MQDERDILTLTDEDGAEIELEVLRYFFYNGEEYCMVTEMDDEGCGCGCEECHHDHGEDEECECEPLEVFFMKVEAADDENEEYSFVDEELSQKLMEIIESEEDEEDAEDDEEPEQDK